jgi:hypothetical protein
VNRPELDAFLDAVDHIDEPEPIGSPVEAEWALHRLAKLRSMRAETRHEHKLMTEKYDAWMARRDEPMARAEAIIEEQLRHYALARIAAEPSGPKSFDLPSGTISTRKGSVVAEFDDEEAFLQWVLALPPEGEPGHFLAYAPSKPHIHKFAVKEALQNGEVLPGVRLVEKDRTVDIKTEAPDA